MIECTDHEYNELRRRVMAAMETGNQGVARTVLREFKEVAPEAAERLHADVITTYGIHLI